VFPRQSACQCLIYVAFVEGSYSWNEVVIYDVPTGLQYPLLSYANLRDISVSPDGQQLYIVQNRPARLLTVDIYTGTIRSVLNGFVEYPIISRDGETLAYELDIDFGTDITSDSGVHLMNIESRIYQRIAPYTNTPIAWYPDNQNLSVSLWNEDAAESELWLIHITTGEQTLLFTKDIPIGWHDWHPDGNLLTYAADDGVYLYNLQTDTTISLTDNSRRPVWSDDGERFAYIEQQDPSGIATINIANSDGEVVRHITYSGNGFITRANWWQPR